MNDEGASCQELLFKIMKNTGSMMTLRIEVKVKIIYLIVVGASCLSASFIKSAEL